MYRDFKYHKFQNTDFRNLCPKVSKYGVFSGPNTGKHGAEKAPYLGTFDAVKITFH